MKKTWIIATRGSKLAVKQSEKIRDRLLEVFPELSFCIRTIQTTGDRKRQIPLRLVGEKGIFTKEIEEALLKAEVDLAVHSLKDLSTELPEGLEVAAVPEREDPRDVLVSRDHVLLEHLPSGAKIGTSSLRRKIQILKMKPDLAIEETRGNIHTRIKKVYAELLDAIMIAKSGLVRLGLEEWITQEFDIGQVLPAVGQGALAVEIRSSDDEAKELIRQINNQDLFDATAAERAFLKALGGGCRQPIAAYGEVQGEGIFLRGMVASSDGSSVIYKESTKPKEKPDLLGQELARTVLNAGANEILEDLK